MHGPPSSLSVDDHPADRTMRWAKNTAFIRASVLAITNKSLVERTHELPRKNLQVFMKEHSLKDLPGLHDALCWVVPSFNDHTFVDGFKLTQLAVGNDKATINQLQMVEQKRLHKQSQLKFSAPSACTKAEVDVKLSRALLKKFLRKR